MARRLNGILLTLVIFNVLNVKAAKKVQPRIVGGTATTISQRPYLVNLRIGGKFTCGGTLIRSTIVISAAHCVKGVSTSSLTVQGGTTYLSESGVVRKVAKTFLPAAFNLKTLVMDVSVLKLASPMTGANIRPIPLCSFKLSVGDTVVVSGWGRTSENNAVVPNQVRTAQIKMLRKSKCATDYRGQVTIRNSMICAGIPGRKDACTGDSGGPLVRKNELCGIVSFGAGCGRTAYPGVYTSISAVRSFINKVIN